MIFVIINIILIGILCFSSLYLIKHRKKADITPVSGENQVDKLYVLYFTKKYIMFKSLTVILGSLTFVLAAIELLMFKYYRFLNFNEGTDFMKKVFMDFFLKTGNLLRDENTIILMLISMLVLLIVFLINFFICLKVRNAFCRRVKQYMKENIPSMYDHVKFKPRYLPKYKALILRQDRFNEFLFDQNAHTFSRYYKTVGLVKD